MNIATYNSAVKVQRNVLEYGKLCKGNGLNIVDLHIIAHDKNKAWNVTGGNPLLSLLGEE